MLFLLAVCPLALIGPRTLRNAAREICINSPPNPSTGVVQNIATSRPSPRHYQHSRVVKAICSPDAATFSDNAGNNFRCTTPRPATQELLRTRSTYSAHVYLVPFPTIDSSNLASPRCVLRYRRLYRSRWYGSISQRPRGRCSARRIAYFR